jgi:hypothetical protein
MSIAATLAKPFLIRKNAHTNGAKLGLPLQSGARSTVKHRENIQQLSASRMGQSQKFILAQYLRTRLSVG